MSVTNPFLICSNINVLHFYKKKPAQTYHIFYCCLYFDSVDEWEKKIFNFYVHLSKLPRSSQPANILVRFSIVVIFLSICAYCLQTDFVMYLNNKYMQLYLGLHSSYICELVSRYFLVSYTNQTLIIIILCWLLAVGDMSVTNCSNKFEHYCGLTLFY